MPTQAEQATTFANLHIKGDPLILFNIWDAGSAKAVQDAGAKAIATGSWSVANAHGYEDREQLPFDLVVANTRRIVTSVNLPVSIDLEGGYGQSPEEVKQSVSEIVKAGAVGINFEDQIVGGEGLYTIEEQAQRIAAIREASEQASVPVFINARTDIFLKLGSAAPQDHHLEEAIDRATAYAQSGASGFFAPGLREPELIEKLCESISLPVNIMYLPGLAETTQLAELGVSRISYGPFPYRQVMKMLMENARAIIGS
ncbi:MAG: isocitrate lyase/phosphoenolpyruvate mutase family protein [Chloroflexi bacterium]|nr:isocitrate lyase/phosphoenolpyruvate mutase family protein [Chloroflexota bacterium]